MRKRIFGAFIFVMLLFPMTMIAGCGSQENSGDHPQPVALSGISISNKEELTAVWKLGEANRRVQVVFTPDSLTMENTQFTVSSDNENVITVTGKSLKAVGAGKAVVTANAEGFSDSVEISVGVNLPVLNVIGGDTPRLFAGEKTPVASLVVAESWEGTSDLTDFIEVTIQTGDEQNVLVTDGELTFLEPGEYRIACAVTDPRDSGATTSETIEIHVYRNPLAEKADSVSLGVKFEADEKQTATFGEENYWEYAQYNMPASKLYYAEVIYEIPAPAEKVLTGMAHFADNDTRLMWAAVDRGSAAEKRNFQVKDFDTEQQINTNVEQYIYSYRLSEFRGLSDPDAGKVKVAVARDGDYFYTFINDQYVNAVTLRYYRDKNTVPGLFGDCLGGATATGMRYFGGEAATEKLNALIGQGQMISAYVPSDWAAGSKTNFGSAVSGAAKNSDGLAFDYVSTGSAFNADMVSPYIYFDGDFTFEWVYKNTGYAPGDSWRNGCMLSEVRPWNYGNEIFQFGAEYKSESDRKFFLQDYVEDSRGFDDAEGVRFTVRRVLYDDHAEYTLTATSVANPAHTATKTLQYSGEKWNEPVQILWHNTNVSGQFSQITWVTSGN